MATNISSAQFERLKRKAKKFSREHSISHSEALDRIALQSGFKNWSLLAKSHMASSRSRLSKSTLSATASPPASAPTSTIRTRHYLHGDEIEHKPGLFFCRRCDLSVDASHFASLTEHSEEDHGERYLADVANWNRIRDEKYWLRRPEEPANALKASALAAREAYEFSRSPFHRWLEQQKHRDDQVGDLAGDVLSDKGFPVGELRRRALESRLARHGDHVIRALRAAWREFEAGVGR